MNTYKSNAKINIFLDVISLLDNGYHNIRSIFCEVSIFDLIKYDDNQSGKLHYFDFDKNTLSLDNLIVKAGSLFSERFKKIPIGIDFYLKKNIPIGGGLGGGSSNAASIIKILNNHWNIKYENKKLKKISQSIGADVPFFIKGGIQKVTGFGQITNEIKIKTLNLDILLIFPDINVSTKKAYQLIDKADLSKNDSINKKKYNNLIEAIQNDKYKMIIDNIYNKFEEVVFHEYPELTDIYNDILNANADKVFMSGSGSTLVGVFPSKNKARNGLNILKKSGYKVKEVKIIF